jgi:glucan phosphorylase
MSTKSVARPSCAKVVPMTTGPANVPDLPQHSGKFSSDRTIAEYAADIWKVEPCPVR